MFVLGKVIFFLLICFLSSLPFRKFFISPLTFAQNLPIYLIETKERVTVEICIQGGIDAANGFSSNFRVVPVQVVSTIPRLRRDTRQSASQSFSGTKKDESFEQVLQQKLSGNEPLDCYTVTYGRNRQLQTFFYQPKREYTY